MFLVIWAFFYIKDGTGIQVTPALALLPLLVIQMVIVAVGFGLQLWHYAYPVAYGLQHTYLNCYRGLDFELIGSNSDIVWDAEKGGSFRFPNMTLE